MSTLALFGGEPVRTQPWPKYPEDTPGRKAAWERVYARGEFSTFLADKSKAFLGGTEVKAFEKEFALFHKMKYATVFNSATSALHAAVHAACNRTKKDRSRDDHEILVPALTFTSSASCALMTNAIPVFVDVNVATACIDPNKIEAAITPRTRAIIVVHYFGQCADMDPILEIARKHKLLVVEDVAQAPGALYKGRLAGTMGDCGIFSLQESKHIQAGEGGMLITNDIYIARVARLIRNHGEVIPTKGRRTYNSEIVGYNYRMVEGVAALGREGLHDLPAQLYGRRLLARMLSSLIYGTADLKGLAPIVASSYSFMQDHAFYVYMFRFSPAIWGCSLQTFAQALTAEGVPASGTQFPLYLQTLYQKREHRNFRLHGGPFFYNKGQCPVAERLHGELLMLEHVRPPATLQDMHDIRDAILKLWEHKNELAKWEKKVQV